MSHQNEALYYAVIVLFVFKSLKTENSVNCEGDVLNQMIKVSAAWKITISSVESFSYGCNNSFKANAV